MAWNGKTSIAKISFDFRQQCQPKRYFDIAQSSSIGSSHAARRSQETISD